MVDIKRYFLGGFFCTLVLLANACSNNCPATYQEDMDKDANEINEAEKGDAQKKLCKDKVAKYEKMVGCTLPEKDKDGKEIDHGKDDKGNKITTLKDEAIAPLKKYCDKL